MRRILALVIALAVSGIMPVQPAYSASVARIKDIASLQAGRDNQLIGYGLVVGLQGFRRQSSRVALHRARCATLQ